MSYCQRSFVPRHLFVSATILFALGGARAAKADIFGSPSRMLIDGFEGNVQGDAYDFDRFGQAIAVGDFDGDGGDDLAISDSESLDDDERGAVHILYSRSSGLGGLLFDFTSGGTPDSEPFDEFGKALASGDFNGDGFHDLAVGVPGEDVDGIEKAGTVAVIYGSENGLSGSGPPAATRWRLGVGLSGTARQFDRMGDALVSGDFDNDGRDDLAIGIPGRFLGNGDRAGEVVVLYGSTSGLTATDHRFFSQDSIGPDGEMQDLAEASDLFGDTLTVGDFNGDAFDDLVVSAPGESLLGASHAGVVHVLYGFPTAPGLRGLRLTNNQAWNETNIAAAGIPENGDNFGSALAAGDLTGDGIDDLAIGAPFEDHAGFEDCGAVTAMYGQFGVGLHPDNSRMLTQDVLFDGEELFPFDSFGFALAIGDFARASAESPAHDLAIGIPNEGVIDVNGSEVAKAGAVTIVPGSFDGLDRFGARLWAQGYRGSAGAEQLASHSFYGYTLAAGDFDGNGHDDLAIGATGVNALFGPGAPSSSSGAAYILFGALFADGFASGNTDLWSVMEP